MNSHPSDYSARRIGGNVVDKLGPDPHAVPMASHAKSQTRISPSVCNIVHGLEKFARLLSAIVSGIKDSICQKFRRRVLGINEENIIIRTEQALLQIHMFFDKLIGLLNGSVDSMLALGCAKRADAPPPLLCSNNHGQVSALSA